MKKMTLIAAGVSLVLACCVNNSSAQTATDQTPAPAPAPGPATQPVVPPPGPRPPMRPRQPRPFIQRAINDLRMVKTELSRSQDDFGGHKDSALAACDKAMEELQAVIKAMPAPITPQHPGPGPGGAPAPASQPPASAPASTTPTPAQPPQR